MVQHGIGHFDVLCCTNVPATLRFHDGYPSRIGYGVGEGVVAIATLVFVHGNGAGHADCLASSRAPNTGWRMRLIGRRLSERSRQGGAQEKIVRCHLFLKWECAQIRSKIGGAATVITQNGVFRAAGAEASFFVMQKRSDPAPSRGGWGMATFQSSNLRSGRFCSKQADYVHDFSGIYGSRDVLSIIKTLAMVGRRQSSRVGPYRPP